MSLPFPWPIYGYISDSNEDKLANAYITVKSGNTGTPITVISNSGGKYAANLMNVGYSGCTMIVNANGDGERYADSFKLVIGDLGKNQDIILREAEQPADISLSTAKRYGNDLFIFSPYNKESWLKTIDE